MDQLFIGVDLGGTKIYTAISDKTGRILAEHVVLTEASKGPEQVVNKIIYSIKKVSENFDKECIKGIGIGTITWHPYVTKLITVSTFSGIST